MYLKKTSQDLPDIDAFTLKVIFRNYTKRLQFKINEVRDFCKRSNLDAVLRMRSELVVFTTQLQEME